jgi:ABC-type transport system involved in multi-copper enzyme maturation permease subunit
MNVMRIWTIAFNGYREVIRDRILYFIGFFSILLVVILRFLPEVAVGTEDQVFLDFGLASIELLSVVISIFIGTGLINKEIEKRTLLILIPKPISKVELIFGKHLGLSLVLTVMVGAMSLIYLILMSLSKISYSFGAIALSIVYLLLELALIVAVSLMFGSFSSSILATLMSFGIYLMGNFSQQLVNLGKLSKNENIESITQTLYLILPDLSRLNLKNDAVYGILPSTSDLISHALYGGLYTVLLLLLAILIFSQKEF